VVHTIIFKKILIFCVLLVSCYAEKLSKTVLILKFMVMILLLMEMIVLTLLIDIMVLGVI